MNPGQQQCTASLWEAMLDTGTSSLALSVIALNL